MTFIPIIIKYHNTSENHKASGYITSWNQIRHLHSGTNSTKFHQLYIYVLTLIAHVCRWFYHTEVEDLGVLLVVILCYLCNNFALFACLQPLHHVLTNIIFIFTVRVFSLEQCVAVQFSLYTWSVSRTEIQTQLIHFLELK